MKLGNLLILLSPMILALSACSSGEVEMADSAASAPVPSRSGNLRQNNPFEWKNEDVQSGGNGTFEGGKRSTFDQKKLAPYGKNKKSPGYLSRDYNVKRWSGSKGYSTGSYQVTEPPRESGLKSWFGGKKSRYSGNQAGAKGKSYATGSYQTGSARESGKNVSRESNAYTRRQNRDRKPILIIEKEEYRQLSVDQSKSLLGKGLRD